MIYDYKCLKCGEIFRLSDVPMQHDSECLFCGSTTERLITQSNFSMKLRRSKAEKGIIRDIYERMDLEEKIDRKRVSADDAHRMRQEIAKIDSTPVTGGDK
jgi:putative FmdB family regulatory protein